MGQPFTLSKQSHWHCYDRLYWPMSARGPWCLLALIAMLAAATFVVYSTGGTAYAYPYLILVPVLFSAAWYGLVGGLLCALVAGLAMAAMPLDVARDVDQAPSNWLLRLLLYLVLGGVAGWLFQSLRRAFREHERVVRTDTRSNLPNQAALEDDLHSWLNSYKSRTSHLGLIVVRITDIVEVLEAMGADASDELAARVGRRFEHLLADRGRVYRFSVSELMLLAYDVDDKGLADLADRILEAGEQNVVLQGLPVRVQPVLGASFSGDHARDELTADSLISEARIALFTAMDRKLSYCHYVPEFKQKTRDNIQLIARVRHGLDHHEFEIHYQPKINVQDGSLAGCECLIRWRDGHDRFIPPGRFMPKVESTTLITPVTEFVSREGCDFIKQFPKTTSINFSAHNLADERLLKYLEKLVKRCGIDPGLVEIELTESALIQNLDTAREAIQHMRNIGFGVSIDDFGTGFASFDYLRRLPITGIKIDRAFVCDLETDERSRKLMGCMVDLGHALDLVVTAEGVETAGQYRILKTLGCDQAQGFYFAPGLPAKQFLAWSRYYRAVDA